MMSTVHSKNRKILKSFEKLFPNKRLLAIQLDGFSHHVVYDDIPRDIKAHSLEISFYMGVAEESVYCRDPEKKALLKAARQFLQDNGFAHHLDFQNNPMEIIFVDPEDR